MPRWVETRSPRCSPGPCAKRTATWKVPPLANRPFQFGRKVVRNRQLADDARGALGMAGANRVPLALLDDLALLRHPPDDAVDRLLLSILKGLDVVAVAQISHTSLPRSNTWSPASTIG
jgi:hypothetical protein